MCEVLNLVSHEEMQAAGLGLGPGIATGPCLPYIVSHRLSKSPKGSPIRFLIYPHPKPKGRKSSHCTYEKTEALRTENDSGIGPPEGTQEQSSKMGAGGGGRRSEHPLGGKR